MLTQKLDKFASKFFFLSVLYHPFLCTVWYHLKWLTKAPKTCKILWYLTVLRGLLPFCAAVTSLIANGSTAFIWKLCSHWLKDLCQLYPILVSQDPGPFCCHTPSHGGTIPKGNFAIIRIKTRGVKGLMVRAWSESWQWGKWFSVDVIKEIQLLIQWNEHCLQTGEAGSLVSVYVVLG